MKYAKIVLPFKDATKIGRVLQILSHTTKMVSITVGLEYLPNYTIIVIEDEIFPDVDETASRIILNKPLEENNGKIKISFMTSDGITRTYEEK